MIRSAALILITLVVFLGGLEFAAAKTCCDPGARAALTGLAPRASAARPPVETPVSTIDPAVGANQVQESNDVLESIMERLPNGGPPFFRWHAAATINGNRVTNNLGLVMDHDVSINKPAGTVRVVTLGASTTQGALQVPEFRYPTVLQQLLKQNPATANWEVINAGHQGWGVRDVEEFLRTDILPLQPDILIYYGEINDVAGVASGAYVASKPSPVVATFVNGLKVLRQDSKLWQYYLAPNLDPVLPGTGSVGNYNWADLLQPWENGVQDILDTAQDNGIKVLLVTYSYAVRDGQQPTQPMRLYADQGGWPAMKDPIRQFREGVAQENAMLQGIAQERHVPVVHAAEQLDGKLQLFNDTVHMTPEGYAQLARLIDTGLLDQQNPPVVPGPASRPRILLAYEPADTAHVGDVVHLNVTAQAPLGNLASVVVAVNRAADGSATGDWLYLGRTTLSGRTQQVNMDWDTIDFTPGDHRVAINLELQGGDTFWWYQQPSRIYHVLAGSGAAASRPAITDLRYAPEEATAGQPVSVEVDATGGGTDLSSVQLAVNTAADGSTSADWVYVGTVAVTGNSATARFSWDTTGLAPGSHAVAINLVLADGRTVYWYQQPTREYQLN